MMGILVPTREAGWPQARPQRENSYVSHVLASIGLIVFFAAIYVIF